MMKSLLNLRVLGTVVLLSVCVLGQQDKLEQNFKNPPDSAKPRVWWHWMNGNITKEGIKLDLEWMKRVGIGGFQNFDAALNTPKLVDNRLVYMTPEWKDAFKYATTLADKLGLEEAIAGSPGWSESGGPWVKPSQGMKKFVWSEMTVEGGRQFVGALPKPPSVSGPFQEIPIFPRLAIMSGETPKTPPAFYTDTAVIAYRLPEGETVLDQSQAKVTSSGSSVDPLILADDDLIKTTPLTRAPVGQEAWLQFEFSTPQTVRGVIFAKGSFGSNVDDLFGRGLPGPDIQVSDDGQSFRKLVTIPGDGAAQHTLSFPPVTARFFRASFVTPQPTPPRREFDVQVDRLAAPPSNEYKIAELKLLSTPRVNRFEDKAGFAPVRDLIPFPTPPAGDQEAVAKTDIVDLTSKMGADGTLEWTPPPGRWTVLRFGYSLTGVTNHPASPEGTGPEVDKLSRVDVKQYMETYLDSYKSAVGDPVGMKTMAFFVSTVISPQLFAPPSYCHASGGHVSYPNSPGRGMV